MFPLARAAFVFAGQCQDWEAGCSARMAPKRATTLVLLVTISTQVILTLWHWAFYYM